LSRDIAKDASTSALLDAALLRLRDMPPVILTSEASHIKVKTIADGGSRLGLKYRISYQTHVTGLENVY
jgi:hypothetical protein